MKKILLLATVVVFTLSAQSQVMKAGVSLSLPVGDAGDISDFGGQLDFAYLFEINEAFQVGPMASFFFYNGKDFNTPIGKIDGESLLFLPLGGSARFLLEDFFFGADLGYGIGLSPDGNDGGFFYRPKVGYNFGSLAAILSYSGISSERTVIVNGPFGPISSSSSSTFGSINAGVEFSF
ncbi:MAG: hypothetical protein WBA61_00645 [Aequorivita sp.]